MLVFVPVNFDVYRHVRPHVRWTLQLSCRVADRAGRCFPSVRKLAAVTGSSKSAVARHLVALEREGHLTRHRKPGGMYSYQIGAQFLPAARGVSPKTTRPPLAGVSRRPGPGCPMGANRRKSL